MNKKMRCAVLVAVMTATTSHAEACKGGHFESRTVLPALPKAAMPQTVVAKVEIIEIIKLKGPDWRSTNLAKGVVREAIKGVTIGEVITINSIGRSCDQRFNEQSIGQIGFIAGRMETDDKSFVGAWYYNGDFKPSL